MPKVVRYVGKVCDYCEKEFEAPYKGKYHTTSYCPECTKKRVWIKTKKNYDKTPKVRNYLKELTTFE